VEFPAAIILFLLSVACEIQSIYITVVETLLVKSRWLRIIVLAIMTDARRTIGHVSVPEHGRVVALDTRIIYMLWIRGTNICPDWTRIVSEGAIIPKLQMGAEPITRRDPNSTTAHIGSSILFQDGSVDLDVIAVAGINGTSSLLSRIV
jgi:hypothetical protein